MWRTAAGGDGAGIWYDGHVDASIEMMPASHPVTLWLIEDSAPFRVSLARGLERAGAFVCTGTFASAEEALEEAARGGRPQVVLIDVGLPGMDGIEALEPLRQNTRTQP